MIFIGAGIVLVSAVVGYMISDMYKPVCDASGIESKLDAYIKYASEHAKDHHKIIDGLNKQLKMLADELVRVNKRIKKLENK
jgi:hypothetical protein